MSDIDYISCRRCRHYRDGEYDFCYHPRNIRIDYRGCKIPQSSPETKNAHLDCGDFEQKEKNKPLKFIRKILSWGEGAIPPGD